MLRAQCNHIIMSLNGDNCNCSNNNHNNKHNNSEIVFNLPFFSSHICLNIQLESINGKGSIEMGIN